MNRYTGMLLLPVLLFTSLAAQSSRFGRAPAQAVTAASFSKQKLSSGSSIAAASAATSSADSGIVKGADWLKAQQTADGRFPWEINGRLQPDIQGTIARGELVAYDVTRDTSYLNAAVKTGNYLVNSYPRSFSDGDPEFAAHDVMFLEELTTLTNDARYAQFVQTHFWDKLNAGTYGENNDKDAGEWAAGYVGYADYHHWVALRPWFMASPAIAAHYKGQYAIRDSLMNSILKKLEATTSSDKDGDLTGLAGAIWASAHTGIDLDPTAGRWAGSNSTADLVATLVSYQRSGGDWPYDTGSRAAKHVGDVSTTTWAVMALKAWDPVTYAANIASGLSFIESNQQPNGQILTNPGYAPETETGVEVHAEALQVLGTDGGMLPVPETAVAVKVLLEGPYDPSAHAMTTALRGSLPLTSPYSQNPVTVDSIGREVVDWVLVQLRNTADGTVATSRSAFLHKDGRIVAEDGRTNKIFLPAKTGTYSLVVQHRNHLAIMTAGAITTRRDLPALYDFTTAQTQAYGTNPMKQVEANVFAMLAGDGNGDGRVDDADRNSIWRPQNGTSWSYDKGGDFNLDGGIDAIDRNRFWRANSGSRSSVP
ncbi:MAG: hypothetical protein ONB48_14420 [candidate division KSB1 bacterium]|nr:hypothetical protein [candidate division KSB1 bacterium]MDZ7273568.1 hypothetical protein [candidate division KSB1 bacterium]MDZ7286841.1 hypothetical protein [candidate division KSB1 bacterium]MDZ7299802.1 hypothetical protein [candidate division KSB1 bacterium]MDZ7308647.1 hypothetical protein [candidate division KSB1 bacterium]